MADPQAATLTQLRNIQVRTGKTIAELLAAVASSGLAKHGQRRAWLMEQFKLGYGDAHTVALFADKPLPDLSDAAPAAPLSLQPADPLEALYAGAKAQLRPLHETVMQAVAALGPCELAPKKTYISLRRKKQFAMLGPATKDLIELGLNVKSLPPHPRLKVMPPGGMCQYTVRLGQAQEVDETLTGWLRAAYDAAG
jgi:hypothetical protein